MDFKKILEGVRNSTFPPKELKSLIEQTQKERMAICIGCEMNTTPGEIDTFSKCSSCGCFLKLKTASLSSNCGLEMHNKYNPNDQRPLKWFAVSTEQEDLDIQKAIEDAEQQEKPR